MSCRKPNHLKDKRCMSFLTTQKIYFLMVLKPIFHWEKSLKLVDQLILNHLVIHKSHQLIHQEMKFQIHFFLCEPKLNNYFSSDQVLHH